MVSASKKTLTVLFADISESTRLYETLGDLKAKEILSGFMEMMSVVIVKNKGIIVKTIGDEIMSTFETADQAAAAAIGMQEEVAFANCRETDPVTLRIGFHYGEVIIDGNDVFGDTVNIAARMVSQAKANQIITNGDTLKAIALVAAGDIRYVDQTRIKGKQKVMKLYELIWGEPDEMTMIGTTSSPEPLEDVLFTSELMLSYKDQTVKMDEKSPGITIGRLPSCDLVVTDRRVSRLHARIEFRRNKFVLIDQSTNGTYISKLDAKPTVIRRDELVLNGEGFLSLGRRFDKPDKGNPIRYACREK
ncbi:MAG: adenylate/guanylate cyclase domain-containing protein [Desulfobacteraceae bacterium]|nr:adenylate/guanylate cyclase domain-containing protein [Desulfobacteraceae bacterium]